VKYFDLRTNVVWQFGKVKVPEDGQVRPKHIAIDCDFNSILNKKEIVKICLSCIKVEAN
jgi:hypothetical protein